MCSGSDENWRRGVSRFDNGENVPARAWPHFNIANSIHEISENLLPETIGPLCILLHIDSPQRTEIKSAPR